MLLKLYCPKCGTQLPDDASFCLKCGTRINVASGGSQLNQAASSSSQPKNIIAPSGVTSLKCPNCGAPIAPKFGEMIITCQYCGSAVSLGTDGWSSIQKQTMLPLKVATTDDLNGIIRPMMDKGLLHRHLQESSTQEEMKLSYVPYWIVSVSARTSIIATSEVQAIGQTATTAALMGVILGGMGGGFGGRRRAFWDARAANQLINFGTFQLKPVMMFGYGMMGGGVPTKSEQMDENYSFPVVALKALTAYQPRDYQFNLSERTLFDITKIPKNIPVLNGDISEDVAKQQAKTLVDQLQSEKAHAKYHMIQRIYTESDVGDVELLHAPIWFARYDHKGNKIVLVLDASSGRLINSMGL
jgi:hypothetical protein